jgi:hypothetical protein
MSSLKIKILLITIILKYQKYLEKKNLWSAIPFDQMGVSCVAEHLRMIKKIKSN